MKTKLLLTLSCALLTAGCHQSPPERFEIVNGETADHHWLPEMIGSSSTHCLKLDRFTGETWELSAATNGLVWLPLQ